MVEWIQENTKELLSAIGAAIVGIVGLFLKKNSGASVNKQKVKAGKNSTINQAGGNISINSGGNEDEK
jgi:hypothetical protein